jgi:enamine deaminase RidA (YjgF/YER057c/UK114 family)
MKVIDLLYVAVLLLPVTVSAQSIKRVVQNGEPVASVVEVPAGGRTVFIGGQSAASRGILHTGDTEAQTVATLERIRAILKERGMSMGDIVILRVFLGTDPRTGKADREGMAIGFRQFFGTKSQLKLPTRTVLQVDGMDDHSLVVIEAEAVHFP